MLTKFTRDDEIQEGTPQMQLKPNEQIMISNPYLDTPSTANAVEYKKGYVMRKCCYEANAKRSEYQKMSW